MTTPDQSAPRGDTLATGLWKRFLSQGVFDAGLWILIVASWGFLMVRTSWNLLEISIWSVPFLLLIAAASTPWRTIRWRTVFGFFMFGVGPMFLLAALVGWGLDAAGLERALQRWLLGTELRLDASADVIAPVFEELLKVLPLLLFMWWRKSGLRASGGPLDFAVLAGATGAGMAFAEDTFVYLSQGTVGAPPASFFGLGLGRIYAGLVGAEPSGFPLTGRSDFADNFSFFYPEMQDLFGMVWSGHGALALGIGLAIGLALWWSRSYGSRLFYLVPVAVFVWAVFEHLMANWYGGSGCSRGGSSVLCTMASVDLHGRVLPILILAGWGYAMWVSGRQLRIHRREDPSMRLTWAEVDRHGYTSSGVRGWQGLAGDWFDFLRWRRKVGYGAFHLAFTSPNTLGQVTSLMASRAKALLLKERLVGSTPTPVSPATVADIDWLAPTP